MNGEAVDLPVTAGASSVTEGGRKKLPSVPEPGSPSSTPASQPNLPSPRTVHSYGPFFMEYSLLAEYNQIQKQKLPGVYVIPSARSPRMWFGVLFIRQGIYQEGVFKFTLSVPEKYPDGDCPGVVFDQPVFHPVIHPATGELDVKRAFQKWRRNVNHLWQVLLYVRRVFYKIDTKNPLNPEAAVLYEKDLDMYKSRVVESVESCKQKLYDPPKSDDPHEIRFSPYDETVHDSAKNNMLQPKTNPHDEANKNAQLSGLSWMKKGSNEIFSRDDCPSL